MSEETEDPYVALGLERDATSQQIKDAHRRQAKVNHPDLHHDKSEIVRNAYARQFQRTQAAFELLSDPEEKAFYDKNGYTRNQKRARPLSRVDKTILGIFSEAFNILLDDVTTADYPAQIGRVLRSKQATTLQQVRQLRTAQKKLEQMKGRWKRSDDPQNPLAELVEEQLKRIVHDIAEKEGEATHYGQCIDEVACYSYARDLPTQRSVVMGLLEQSLASGSPVSQRIWQ